VTIEQKFKNFHAANPHVYAKVRELAFTVKARGDRRFGMKAVFEQLRWLSAFDTTNDLFKLNNDFTAYYTRLLLKDEPELRAVFTTRRSQADSIAAAAA
jgi:hypothetical protein